MKTKNISYILLSSIFIINGCGSSSTSNNNSSTNATEEAVYITPLETNTSDTSYKVNTITSGSRNSYKVNNNTLLEDAEDGTTDGWRSYDNSPSPVTISNIYDNRKQSKVINLKGVGLKNGSYFSLGNDSSSKTIKWSMNFNSDYILYVRLNTKDGLRYIYYTPVNYNYGKSPIPYDYYIHHGLGSDSKSGTWKTFSRDLTQDLQEFEPNNTINSIDGLYIRGSGRIDDIALLSTSIDSECVGYHDLRNKINNNEDVTHANISCITDLSAIFSNNKTFNQDISAWDTSNVTNMAWMFNGASAFNQDISSWETAKVTNMSGMFNHAYSFNQNINAWDTSHVTEMDYTFTHAEAFNQDLSLWQVDNVQSHKAFTYAAAKGVIEPNWEGSNNLLSQIQEALASQIDYSDPITTEDITDLADGNKLVSIKKGFAHINIANPNDFKVTQFNAYNSGIDAHFTSVFSKDKTKLFILSEYEESDVKLQVIDLVTLKEINLIDINQNIVIASPQIYLSDNEQQLIIPKEYTYLNIRDIVIDLSGTQYDIQTTDTGIEIYNITSPEHAPTLVTTYNFITYEETGMRVQNISMLEDRQNILVYVSGNKNLAYYVINISDIHNPITKDSFYINAGYRNQYGQATFDKLENNIYLMHTTTEAIIYNFNTYTKQSVSGSYPSNYYLSKDKKRVLIYSNDDYSTPPPFRGLYIIDISDRSNPTRVNETPYPIDKVEFFDNHTKVEITNDDGSKTIIELL